MKPANKTNLRFWYKQ